MLLVRRSKNILKDFPAEIPYREFEWIRFAWLQYELSKGPQANKHKTVINFQHFHSWMQQTLDFSILSKAKQNNISLANRERFGPEMVRPTPPSEPKVGSRSGFFGRFSSFSSSSLFVGSARFLGLVLVLLCFVCVCHANCLLGRLRFVFAWGPRRKPTKVFPVPYRTARPDHQTSSTLALPACILNVNLNLFCFPLFRCC